MVLVVARRESVAPPQTVTAFLPDSEPAGSSTRWGRLWTVGTGPMYLVAHSGGDRRRRGSRVSYRIRDRRAAQL